MELLEKQETAEPFSRQEAELVRRSSQEIADFVQGEETLLLSLARANGERIEAEIPARAMHLFVVLLSEIAQGNSVSLMPDRAELSTHQAAAMLHVSRPYLIKILEAGKIPFRKVGAHRRIRCDDLQNYIESEQQARKAALDEMTAEAQRLGLYE